jgi:DNA-binding transcriptional LysR family regulator
MLQNLQSTRAVLRGQSAAGQDVLEFALPHTLALTFFPAWVNRLNDEIGPFKSRLMALNVHDAVLRLVEGRCDLLIAYHHDAQPFQLDAERYDMLTLGQEVLAPFVKPAPDGSPLYALPGQVGQPLPYLAYAPGAYLGHLVDWLLKQASSAVHFERVYETDMAEGLKAMALEGHGIAFLPLSAVEKEVRTKQLVSAGAGFEVSMDVRIYREQPIGKVNPKSLALALWNDLLQKKL